MLKLPWVLLNKFKRRELMNTLNGRRKINLKQFFTVKKVRWCPVVLSLKIYFSVHTL